MAELLMVLASLKFVLQIRQPIVLDIIKVLKCNAIITKFN